MMGDERTIRTDTAILADVRQTVQDWHDKKHGLTLLDQCPHEPCNLLPSDFSWR